MEVQITHVNGFQYQHCEYPTSYTRTVCDKTVCSTYECGVNAEDLVASRMIDKGYKLLKKRFKTKCGEIDLVMQKNNTVVFVEVKSRRKIGIDYMSDVDNVIGRKQKERCCMAAIEFLSRFVVNNETKTTCGNTIDNINCRFDLALVTHGNKINYIANAWDTDVLTS